MVEGLLPFASHFMDRGGLKYHYLNEGDGNPVVMLHGNPTWCYYYRNVVAALRATHRCIVPDHIGCGLSDKPDDGQYTYTLNRRVDDLEALLDSLEVKANITLVVHDWGGMIGMAYATRYPDRIKRLVVMNTSAFRLPASKRFPWALWLGRNTGLGEFLIRRFNTFSAVAARIGCKRNPMGAELRRAYTAPYDTWQNRIATVRFVQDIPLEPGDPAWDTVVKVEESVGQFRDTPMLICWGMKDFVFGKEFLALWEKHFPEAQVHRFDDCGHYILEDARDEVVPLIAQFVSGD